MRTRGFTEPSMSIKEKIKIFSGEYIRKSNHKTNALPGKIKIPSMFQKDGLNTERKKEKNKINIKAEKNGNKSDDDKDNKSK